jgi:hypothetical protein
VSADDKKRMLVLVSSIVRQLLSMAELVKEAGEVLRLARTEEELIRK